MTGFLPNQLMFLTAMAIAALSTSAYGQSPSSPTPEQGGLRFARTAQKSLETLAPKPGGPTERIEIQSTNDHIDYVVKTYVLKQANAAEVYEMIQQAVSLEGGTVFRIAPGSEIETDKSNLLCRTKYSGESLLMVTAPNWMIPYLDETIRILDRKDLESAAIGTGGIFVRIKHRKPSEVAEMIQGTTGGPSIVLKPDDARQILYVEDTPSYFGCDLEALQMFDTPPPQIETRVRIFEISDEDSRDVGLDWMAWKKAIGGGNLTFSGGGANPDLKSLSSELSFTPQLATEFLNYLVGRGRAKVITDSRLTQVNTQTATVESTTPVPYVLRGFVNNDVADSPVRDSPEALGPDRLIKEYQEGVVVEMTPRIGLEIELAVKASVASHIGYTPNQSVPLVTRSQVNTVVLLEPGKAAVLGGLSRESRVRARSGVWGLEKIPGLKGFFTREIERKQTSQIILTIELNRSAAGAEPPASLAEALPPLVK